VGNCVIADLESVEDHVAVPVGAMWRFEEDSRAPILCRTRGGVSSSEPKVVCQPEDGSHGVDLGRVSRDVRLGRVSKS
jgi:hypothetical protein